MKKIHTITDNFYPNHIFNRILELVYEYPISIPPKNYNGKRCSYPNRNYLTKSNELSDLILSKFPPIKDMRRKIEIANDTDGFWLYPHSDHPSKKHVVVIYLEGEIGTTFHYDVEETVEFIPNRAIFFNPDEYETYNTHSIKHSVKKEKLKNIRRTIVINYVGNDWRDIDCCYD